MKKAVFILLAVILLLVFAGKLFAQAGNCISGNCVTGTGKMAYADGSVYEGSFVNGHRQGAGTIVANEFVYTGQWKEDNYSGKGRLKKRPAKESPFYVQWDCTFQDGNIDGPGKYSYFYGGDTAISYTGNFKNGQYFGKGSLLIRNICTLYSDSWTDSENFTSGKYVQDKTLVTLYGSYVANAFQKGENDGTTPPGQQSARAFKRFYYHKNNSAYLRDNLMTTELVNTLAGPKNGSINIDLKNNSLTITTEGAEDKIYTIKKVNDETTDQYSNKKLIINCTDATGKDCTATIRREYAYRSDNEMVINITYPNGTGKGYFCTLEENLFAN